MAVTIMAAVLFFIVGLIVSSVIIFAVTKLLGEVEGFETAIPAAIIGAVIFALSYYFLGHGLFAAVISGMVWLVALSGFYNMGFLKSVGVAVLVWIAASFASVVVPTLVGPL